MSKEYQIRNQFKKYPNDLVDFLVKSDCLDKFVINGEYYYVKNRHSNTPLNPLIYVAKNFESVAKELICTYGAVVTKGYHTKYHTVRLNTESREYFELGDGRTIRSNLIFNVECNIDGKKFPVSLVYSAGDNGKYELSSYPHSDYDQNVEKLLAVFAKVKKIENRNPEARVELLSDFIAMCRESVKV